MWRRRVQIVATALLAMQLCACSGDEDGARSAAAPFDAEQYRARITAVEDVLYQTAPPDYSSADRATLAMRTLFDAIAENERNPIKRQEASRLMFAGAGGGSGYAAPDLSRLRAEWESIRADLFGDVEWFRESTAELAARQTPPVPETDPADVEALRRVLTRIDRAIDTSRRECERLGEPDYEPGYEGARGRAHIERWREFHRDWDERVNRIARDLPGQPAWDGDADFLMAHQETGFALNQLRTVPMGTGDWATPFRHQWEQRFATAENHIRSARERLADL